MSQLVPVSGPALPPVILPGVGRLVVPATIAEAGTPAVRRYVEFMAAGIGNRNTRTAYARAASTFFAWCDGVGLALAAIEPVHVTAWIEMMKQQANAPDPRDRLSVPTIKQRLAAVRALFDALVIGQVVPVNPAAAVRGPSYSAKVGKTVVLDSAEARQLLDTIDTRTPIGLRDRALIALMVYSFARVSAALGMNVEDAFTKNRRCSGAQSKCDRRAIKGGFRRKLAETGGGVRRTLRETGRTLSETDARSSERTQTE